MKKLFTLIVAAVQGVNVNKVLPYRPPHMEACMDTIIEDVKKYKAKFLPWLVDPRWKPSALDAEKAGVGVTQVDAIKEYMINQRKDFFNTILLQPFKIECRRRLASKREA